MIFKDLLLKYDKIIILKRLVELYPDQKKNIGGYDDTLNELFLLKPVSSDVQIHIRKYYDKWDKQYYVHVNGIDKNKKIWAMDFTDWKEWLGMKIYYSTLKRYNKLDIICHCLWEMTNDFYRIF